MNRAPLYGSRIAATGVLLLAMSAVLAIAMFRSTLGPFHFGVRAAATPKWRVFLWTRGADSERAYSSVRWHERLEGRFDVQPLTRGEIDRLDGEFDLLILDGVSVGGDEATKLRAFVKNGGRLALFGTRDAASTGSPSSISALLGETVQIARDYRWTLLAGKRGPLSAGFSATERLPLRRAHDVYALPGRDAEVVWAAANRSGTHQGAAWNSAIGAGRLVWWSVRPDVALDRVEAQAAMTRMVRASVAWLLEEPFAQIDVSDAEHPGAFERIDVRLTPRSATRFLLSLTNRSAAKSPGLDLRVYLNRRVVDASLGLTSISLRPGGLELPEIELASNGTEISLRTASIDQGESRAYYLDLVETGTPQ